MAMCIEQYCRNSTGKTPAVRGLYAGQYALKNSGGIRQA